jgi:hypothetical protein
VAREQGADRRRLADQNAAGQNGVRGDPDAALRRWRNTGCTSPITAM